MISVDKLERLPDWMQYLHFLLTTFHPVRFSTWVNSGAPNPFAAPRDRGEVSIGDVEDALASFDNAWPQRHRVRTKVVDGGNRAEMEVFRRSGNNRARGPHHWTQRIARRGNADPVSRRRMSAPLPSFEMAMADRPISIAH